MLGNYRSNQENFALLRKTHVLFSTSVVQYGTTPALFGATDALFPANTELFELCTVFIGNNRASAADLFSNKERLPRGQACFSKKKSSFQHFRKYASVQSLLRNL